MRFPGVGEVPVRWYFTDSEFLDTPTVYNSRNWLTDKDQEFPWGEVKDAPRPWQDGSGPPVLGCEGPCGSPDDWSPTSEMPCRRPRTWVAASGSVEVETEILASVGTGIPAGIGLGEVETEIGGGIGLLPPYQGLVEVETEIGGGIGLLPPYQGLVEVETEIGGGIGLLPPYQGLVEVETEIDGTDYLGPAEFVAAEVETEIVGAAGIGTSEAGSAEVETEIVGDVSTESGESGDLLPCCDEGPISNVSATLQAGGLCEFLDDIVVPLAWSAANERWQGEAATDEGTVYVTFSCAFGGSGLYCAVDCEDYAAPIAFANFVDCVEGQAVFEGVIAFSCCEVGSVGVNITWDVG